MDFPDNAHIHNNKTVCLTFREKPDMEYKTQKEPPKPKIVRTFNYKECTVHI